MHFNLLPTLANDHITLRPMLPDDFEALYAAASDPLIWALHPAKERSERPGFQRFFDDALATGGALVVIDNATGLVIGTSRFRAVENFEQAIEIGWTFLARAYWGGYYNGMMKQLMLDYAFQHVPYVLFFVNEHNLRSQRAVEKIGGKHITELEGIPMPGRATVSVVFCVEQPKL